MSLARPSTGQPSTCATKLNVTEPASAYSDREELQDCTIFWYLYAGLLCKSLDETWDLASRFVTSTRELLKGLVARASADNQGYCETLFLDDEERGFGASSSASHIALRSLKSGTPSTG